VNGLATLTRLAKRELDERRTALALLEDRAARIAARGRENEEAMAREAAFAARSAETPRTLGAYLEAAIERRRLLAAEAEETAKAVAAAQLELLVAFRAFRRCEIIETQQIERARRVAERRDQARLDEIAVDRYRRYAAGDR